MIAAIAAVVTIAIADQPAQLVVDDRWQAVAAAPVPDGPALVMRDDRGDLLAVTVAQAPNTDAWIKKKRDAYEQAIVDGFVATPGVTVKKHATSMVMGTPCVDLVLDRSGPVAVRLLLFRTRTVAIAVSATDARWASSTALGLAPIHQADPDR